MGRAVGGARSLTFVGREHCVFGRSPMCDREISRQKFNQVDFSRLTLEPFVLSEDSGF